MSAWHQARPTWTTVDELDIEFVVQERIPDHGMTRASRRIAARQLTERNATVEEISALLGVNPRTVYRWRREDRQTGRQAA